SPALGGHNWFHGWLDIDAAEAVENLALERNLAIGSAAWASFMALLATVIYTRYPELPKRAATTSRFLYRLLYEKFYVDEIYDATIVQPIRFISDKFMAEDIDQGLIDGVLVNGSARFTAWGGSLVSGLQNGLANNYAFYFLLGLGGFIFFFVVRLMLRLAKQPLLSLLIFLPLAGGFALLAIPREQTGAIRVWTLLVSLATFALSLPLALRFTETSGYQFVELHPWSPTLGIQYHLGVD